MKHAKFLILASFVFLFNLLGIKANTLYGIDIKVNLKQDGSASITETWNMMVDKGTEVYKPMSNLGNSHISNFSVKDESGLKYTPVSSWNINGTLNSKAYKNGINYTNDGLELCWGMGTYGKHIYTISYEVDNFIYNVDDAQVLYWQFINDSMDPAPKEISIEVSGPNRYDDSLDVWGYGYEGYAYVYDGSIYMSNIENRNFDKEEYVVLLVKYPLGTFNTNNSFSKYRTFDDFYNMAQTGATSFEKKNNIFKIVVQFFIGLIYFLMMFLPFILILKIVNSKPKYIKKNINNSQLNNFRDIPCDKDIFKAFFLAEIYGLNNKKEDLLGAVLLKWLKEKQIAIVKQKKKKLFGSKEVTAIDLSKKTNQFNANEQSLYDMMYEASKDGLLEENELQKWCSNNYSKFFKWFDSVLDSVRNMYRDKGNITLTQEGKLFKKVTYTLDDNLYEEAVKLAGLKKFLKEFSRINEKQPIEVNMWEDYLIFAQIFGIADEVSKQFKKLYPEIFENNTYSINYIDIMWINSITSSSISSASAARSRAQSYSSGGGGFSSGGGGGGSFGGSHGGGCR